MPSNFPYITHIDQVKKAIEGHDEFKIKFNDGVLIVNYNLIPNPSTFHDNLDPSNASIRRECRGIEFSESGEIVTRKYHKFHNLNENDFCRIENIDWSKKFKIMEKLDGSMITFYNGKAHTKNGVSDVSKNVDEFIKKTEIDYLKFVTFCDEKKWTPIFEWCSNKNRIVISYPDDKLILTAIRELHSGDYIDYDIMKILADFNNIPIVSASDPENFNIDNLIETISIDTGSEGVVLRFIDNMYKIKTHDYIRLHKNLEKINYEKDILEIIISDKIDDILPILSDEKRVKIINYSQIVNKNLIEYASELANKVDFYKSNYDKKKFAIEVMPSLNKIETNLIFKIWNGSDVMNSVKDIIANNIRVTTDIENIRYIIKEKW